MTSSQLPTTSIVAIRSAGEDDAGVVRRLAALDSAAVPAGPVLLALVDGTPLAAVSVASGKAVADPFQHTAELVDLLRLRATALRAAPVAPSGHGLRRRSSHRMRFTSTA